MMNHAKFGDLPNDEIDNTMPSGFDIVPVVPHDEPEFGDMTVDEVTAKKCLLAAFDDAATGQKLVDSGLPPKPPSETVMKLPVVVSQVRRSPRLNDMTQGLKHCTLDDIPKKRRKCGSDCGDESLPALPSADEGLEPEDIQCPIPMDTLKSWGIECGASSMEVTEALLLKERSTAILDEE